MTAKRNPRTPPVLEHNPQAPLFGDAEGGICRRVYEATKQQLRRLYSTDTAVWTSYEVGKSAYTRVEMMYQRKLYTGIGDREEDAWQDLQNVLRTQCPHPEEDIEVRIVGCRGWFILILYSAYGSWECEGTQPLQILEKLLRKAQRATYVPRGA